MGGVDLSPLVLQDIGVGAMKNSGAAALEAGRVLPALFSLASRLHADEGDTLFIHIDRKEADRIGPSSDAGDAKVGILPDSLLHLPLRFATDALLEMGDKRRERMGAEGRAQAIVGGVKTRGPISERLVDRVFERGGASVYRDYFSAEQLHLQHV